MEETTLESLATHCPDLAQAKGAARKRKASSSS